MESKPNGKRWGRSAAIALLAAGGGAGIGWILWLTMRNIAVAIGIAGPMALLISNLLQKIIK